MIKLINILKEGTISLTQNERDQIEKILPQLIDTISGPQINSKDYKQVGLINYQFADKTPGQVSIWVGNDMPESGGYFQTKDPKNPTDNYIVVQQNNYAPYFGILNKGYSALTGDKNSGIEKLRGLLKHELIHAKDPALNHHYLKEPYDYRAEIYYKSWTEFQTMTGQFFESITSGVDRILNRNPSIEDIKKIEKALDEILNFYSGKSRNLSQDTYDFIQDTDKRNMFQRLIKFLENKFEEESGILKGYLTQSPLYVYIAFINSIKTHNPEGYKEFLKDLYKTIDQAKDKLKTISSNLKENKIMKKQIISEEFRRMQKLAGVITETQLNEEKSIEAFGPKLIERLKASGFDDVKFTTNSNDADKLANIVKTSDKNLAVVEYNPQTKFIQITTNQDNQDKVFDVVNSPILKDLLPDDFSVTKQGSYFVQLQGK